MARKGPGALPSLLVAMATVVACSGSSAAINEDESDSADSTDAADFISAADVESAEATPDDTDGILTLGGIFPQTGSHVFLGPPESAGVQLAVANINAAGGVLGNDVVWLPGDSGDNALVVNATVDRLLAKNVDAIVGAASSNVSLAVIDKITRAGVIQFSPANTSPAFTTYNDSGLYFRTAPSDVLQGAVLADIILTEGVENVAFLVLNDAYGSGLLEFTKLPYEAAGGTVVAEQLFDPNAEDFTEEIAAVVAAAPDGIAIIGYDQTYQLLAGLIEQGFGPQDVPVFGADGNMSNALLAAVGDSSQLQGMKGTRPGVDVAGELQDFRDALVQIDPDLMDFSYSAEAYDAVVVVALAALQAGTDDPIAIAVEINGITKGGEKCTDFAACAELIAAGSDIDYDGKSGPLEFTEAGEPSVASILSLQVNAEGSIDVIGSVSVSVD